MKRRLQFTNQVVFLEPNQLNAVPFTTSAVIAEMTGIYHRHIREAILKYQTQLEKFGKVVAYATTLESGQTAIGYHLTEEQATFLITLLKNTPPVVAFKQELVRQFYAMRTELQKQQIEREMLNRIRRELAGKLLDILSTETTFTESTSAKPRRCSEPQSKKSNSTDDETLLKLVAGLVSATETHSWKGTATELADALKIPEQPNRLTRRLNVLRGRLLEEYNVYYETARTHKGRSVALLYAPPKLEIKTPLQTAKIG